MSRGRAWFCALAGVIAFACMLAAIAPSSARADFVPGTVLGLLSPARTIGRAEAGVAAFWDADDAANPALAAFGPEFELESDAARVRPGVPRSPEFSASRWAFTTTGLGVSLTGAPPLGLGGTRLRWPAPEAAVDTTTMAPSRRSDDIEHAYGIALGASLPALARRMRRQVRLDEPPAFDLALGFAYRSLEEEDGEGSRHRLGGVWDAGAFARWTLVDTRRASREHQSVRLDAAAGLAVANLGRLAVAWSRDSVATPRTTPRVARVGGALSLAMRPCPCAVDAHHTLAWLRGADQAIARVSLTAETQRDVDDGRARSWHVGVEASLGRVLTLRAGRVHDESAMLEHNPIGVGIGIPLGRFGTLRWDQAHAAWARGERQRRIESVRLELAPSAFARRGGR